MKVRENWIDWAKSIGIMLVIMGHYGMGDKIYGTFIYAFHMPLFFIVSGYLFTPPPQDNSYKQFVLKNVRSLIVPYFIFGIFSVLASAALNFFSGGDYSVSFFMKSFAGLVLGVGYDTEYTVMNNMPLWFLPAMFFVRVISGFLSRYKSRVKIAVCAAGLIIVVLLHRYGLFLPFSAGSALLALRFFMRERSQSGTVFWKISETGKCCGSLRCLLFRRLCCICRCISIRALPISTVASTTICCSCSRAGYRERRRFFACVSPLTGSGRSS